MERRPLRSSTARWCPLLTGRAAERAREAVAEVARNLPSRSETILRESPARHMSLAGGKAGFALFYGYLAEVTGEAEHTETAARYLDEATVYLTEQVTLPDLFAGFTGVAWVTEHLTGRIFEVGDGDPNEEVDEVLTGLLRQTPWREDYDLIRGLVGFGIYGLERLRGPSGRMLLEQVVARLDELAVREGDRVTWFTPPELLSQHQREVSPSGYFNVGLAHGMPAVIPLLARTAAFGVAEERARDLLTKSVRWLLDEKGKVGGGSCFPYTIGTDGSRVPSRLAWCYGDLGIAAALLDAAVVAGEAEWRDEALDIARRCAERTPEVAGDKDAGLCHGAAGIAHVFNRLYQGSGDERLAEAARGWFERVWDYHRPGESVAGFPSWNPGRFGTPPGWEADAGFLTGDTGVALALLAAISTVSPDWDRILAISVPPLLGPRG